MKKKKPSKKRPAKPAKKKNVKKKSPASKKKKTVKNAVKKIKKLPKISFGELVGKVTHYFPHVQAAVIKVKAPRLSLGERLRLKGHTTDFKMTLDSMQIDHKPIPKAGKGAEIGIQVPGRVREGDQVYRVKG